MASDCPQIWSISHVTTTIIFLLISIFLCFLCIKRLMDKSKIDEKGSKSLNVLLLILCISTIITLSSVGGADVACIVGHGNINNETNQSDYVYLHIVNTLWTASYALQMYSLMLFFYLRIYYPFSITKFRLSKITKYCFSSIFILIAVCICIASVLFNFDGIYMVLGLIIAVFMLILFILMDISLLCLFVYKLVAVINIDHSEEDNGKSLLNLITKTTVLKLISTFMTLTNVISFAITNVNTSYHLVWIWHFCFLFDMFSNFLSVILSLKFFNIYYDTICKYADNGCKQCCYKCFGNKIKTEIKMMQTHANDHTLTVGSASKTSTK